MGMALLSNVPGLVVPSPWGLASLRSLCKSRSAVAGLSLSRRSLVGSSRCNSPCSCSTRTNSGRYGTRRLLQMPLAARQHVTRACSFLTTSRLRDGMIEQTQGVLAMVAGTGDELVENVGALLAHRSSVARSHHR